jgi:hypothetical protein
LFLSPVSFSPLLPSLVRVFLAFSKLAPPPQSWFPALQHRGRRR